MIKINTNTKSYTLSTYIPDECPPTDITLMINGTEIAITWEDGTTENKKVVQSAGEYNVTIVDTKNNCTYEETFTIDDNIFNDTDGDGYCDDVDCAPYSAEIGGPGKSEICGY